MRYEKRRIIALVSVGALALALGACSKKEGGGGSTPCDDTTMVCVTEKDFVITASPASGAAGTNEFSITNSGPNEHELVIVKTELAADALPVTNSVVDESSGDLKVVAEREDINAGTTASLNASLEAGSYALICNLPGHYKAGMHAAFSVE